jgi:hypothetical protein
MDKEKIEAAIGEAKKWLVNESRTSQLVRGWDLQTIELVACLMERYHSQKTIELIDRVAQKSAFKLMREALVKISDPENIPGSFSPCECDDHESPDCCCAVDYWCPQCIAGRALLKLAEGGLSILPAG